MTLTIGATTYTVDTFPLPIVVDTNPLPLDLALSGSTLWLSCEFDRRIYSVPVSAAPGTTMTGYDVPAAAAPMFRVLLQGQDNPSQMTSAERIQATPDGSIWLTQGGTVYYGGAGQEHARVIRRRPNGTWQAFLIPWNTPGAIGLLVEDNGRRLWVTNANDNAGNAVLETHPLSWTPADTDPTRDLSNPPPLGTSAVRGWRTHAITTRNSSPAHIVKGLDGRLYVSLYFANAILAIEPNTGAQQLYPLPPPPVGLFQNSGGPWQMAVGLSGNIWIAEDAARWLTKLNPTTGVATVYDIAPYLNPGEGLHSVCIDLALECIWFTTYSGTGAPNAGRIGRLFNLTGVIQVSPPLTTLGYNNGATGIVLGPGGTLWAALFGAKAVARLTPQ